MAERVDLHKSHRDREGRGGGVDEERAEEVEEEEEDLHKSHRDREDQRKQGPPEEK